MRYESGKDCTIRLRNGTEVLRGRTGFLHVTDKAEETMALFLGWFRFRLFFTSLLLLYTASHFNKVLFD